MRYCGSCGAPLNPAILAEGRCEVCGAAITPTGDVITPGRGTSARLDEAHTFPADDPLGDTAPTRGASFPGGTQLADSTGRLRATPVRATTRTSSIVLVLVGVLVLGLVGILLFSNVAGALLGRTAGAVHTSSSTGNTTSSGSTSTQPTAGATKPPMHATATSAATPGNGATATAMPTATPTPVPPTIDIYPQSVTGLSCNNHRTSFSLSNTGGSSLHWSASPSNKEYSVSPMSGAQPSGAPAITVMVSHIYGPGNITISDPHATNSPQTFQIICF